MKEFQMEIKDVSLKQLESDNVPESVDLCSEENENVERIYCLLDSEHQQRKYEAISLTNPYAIDYTDKDHYGEMLEHKGYAQYADRAVAETCEYCECGDLICGHLKTHYDYFIIDQFLKSRSVGDFTLVSADDRNYQEVLRMWRYPDEKEDINFSRNIEMLNRHVINVDVVYSSTGNIKRYDPLLQRVLLRNKDNSKIHSIISTIEQKQNLIRTFKANTELIVQGCAGSGKTMVLLLRLRYLLFNRDIEPNDFIFITPGSRYNNFIEELSDDFNINKANILSITQYYQMLSGEKKQSISPETNESVFQAKYLERIYSREFLQEVFADFAKELKTTFENLAITCKEKIENDIKAMESEYKKEVQISIDSATKKANDIIKNVPQEMNLLINSYDDIEKCINLLQCNEVINGSSDKNLVYQLTNALNECLSILKTDKTKCDNRYTQMYQRYTKENDSYIRKTADLKNLCKSMDTDVAKHITDLSSAESYYSNLYYISHVLYLWLSKDTEYKDFRLFEDMSITIDLACKKLFDLCAEKIKNEFNIKLKNNNRYKHYWYLKAFCRFLIGEKDWPYYPYIFIDEGQDLSRMEYELIYNFNTNDSNISKTKKSIPLINVFGDIKQTISKHAITSWNEIEFRSRNFQRVDLDQNYRNTNQVIDYCKHTLPSEFAMIPVGVNMENVMHFESVEDLFNRKSNQEKRVFIVKDEYVKSDLEKELSKFGSVSHSINTVSEIKGLEYREVYVIPYNMTDNEKYIAFTRPTVQLNIINHLRLDTSSN